MKQDQFLEVIDRDEAERRWRAVITIALPGKETVALQHAWMRVLALDVASPTDVPSFDRSNMDGFAVRAQDTYGATEESPRRLRYSGESIAPGDRPAKTIGVQDASAVATGAMLPRGADAVVMVEHTDLVGEQLLVRRPVAPGANFSGAGTDVGRGETVLRRGDLLTSREIGVLAAVGLDHVAAVRRPRVAVLSTGNELIAPRDPIEPGKVYDSNAYILADAVREQGGEPTLLGIERDSREALVAKLRDALDWADMILLSGGTSKGEGDLSYRAVADLGPPGVIVHGVALKPGKPLCLAAVERGGRNVPIAVLPGFPTSAIFTFREFVAPVIREMALLRPDATDTVAATLPMRVNSERGRTEYLLVRLVESSDESRHWVAYPMGKGSGSVTAFSMADGFVAIPRQQEYLEANSTVEVQLLSRGLQPADLAVIGSHCVGLDLLLSEMHARGFRCKFLAVGSTAGLEAAKRGECDLAGVHLLDPQTNVYNEPFLNDRVTLLHGYERMQGIVYRVGDARFKGKSIADAAKAALADAECLFINRNRGSGTRILIDRLLGEARPAGWSIEARSHNAVAAAVEQGRADWGIAIETVARDAKLGFLPMQAELYDVVVPICRLERPAVQAFRALLCEEPIRRRLAERGFHLHRLA